MAGKTGTHGVGDEIQSAWFVGYTKQISTAVMYVVGDDGVGDLGPYRRSQDRTFYGSGFPLLTWIDYMEVATGDAGAAVRRGDPGESEHLAQVGADSRERAASPKRADSHRDGACIVAGGNPVSGGHPQRRPGIQPVSHGDRGDRDA
ncbi:MAG: hypothetical protein R2722_09580 [Tessaracoccus sp.]